MKESNIKKLELLAQISYLIEYDDLDNTYYINMNDMFAYGSSESFTIRTDEDASVIYTFFRQYGDLGILLYICEIEDMKPSNIIGLNKFEKKALKNLYKI